MKNSFEGSPEKVLSEEEVMEEIRLLLGDLGVLRLLASREFPYSGEEFTHLDANNVPYGSDLLAIYNEGTNEWENV